MNSIKIGSFVQGNSLIHKLNPKIKFISLILLIVLIFLNSGWEGYISISFFVVLLFILSSIHLKVLIGVFKSIIFMFFFLFLINMFVNHSGYILASWKIFTISSGAITATFYITWRIILTMSFSIILTTTTKPIDLTISIESLMKPLKSIKVPVHIIAMIISISLRFIPTLLDEAERIMKAQASRGVDFKNGSIKEKTKALVSLIIPLFVSSFHKADELANAMEARGYNPDAERTKFHVFKLELRDYISSIFMISFALIIIFISLSMGHTFVGGIDWRWLNHLTNIDENGWKPGI